MLTRIRSAKDEGGFGLVELLVVMTLLGVVGGVVTAALVRGLDSARQTSARTHAIHEIEISLQRVARELRAADPLFITSDGNYAGRVSAEVLRDRKISVVRYLVVPVAGVPDEYRLLQETDTYDLAAAVDGDYSTLTPQQSETTLVTRLNNAGGAVFSYYRSDGSDIDCTGTDQACMQAHGNAAQIRIRLERTLDDGPPILAETRVNIRSTRYGS